jgi:type IV pilus assembly protein PilA
MSSRKCPQCGLVNWASAESCKRCDLNFTDEGEPEAANWSQPGAEQQYQHPYGGPYAYSRPQSKSTGLAITSLIVGVMSFLTLGLLGVGAVVAFVTGIVALKKTRKQPAIYGGEGFAVAGIVLGSISALMFAYVLLIAAIAVPNLLASRRAANEAAVIASLRKISSAEATYYSTKGLSRWYGTLQDLGERDLIDQALASGTKYGYRFDLKMTGSSFEVTATPLTYGRTSSPGTRSFYLSSNDGYVIRAADKKGLEANASDPPVAASNGSYTRNGPKRTDDADYVKEY